MLRAIPLVAVESFVLMRRDRIFIPAVAVGAALALFARLSATWAIDNLLQVLYDVGLFGFQVAGGLVAALWGTKAISDSRQEGSLEVQLAAPVSRSSWLIGKFLGLVICLALYALILIALWQGMLFATGWGRMGKVAIAAFLFMGLGWAVVGALAILFAACARQSLALFATICAWVAGLATAPVADALRSEPDSLSKSLVDALARYWDLGQLNLTSQVFATPPPTLEALLARASYGVVLIAVIVTVACLIFARRDLFD